MKKLQPKRYVFEETGEYREALFGELYLNSDYLIPMWYSKDPLSFGYKILRKVDE